VKPLLKALE
jgi:hypothetical protein